MAGLINLKLFPDFFNEIGPFASVSAVQRYVCSWVDNRSDWRTLETTWMTRNGLDPGRPPKRSDNWPAFRREDLLCRH